MRTTIALLTGILWASATLGAPVETYNAKAVLVKNGSAQLLKHASLPFGIQCKSGPVADMPELKQVRLGDTITMDKHTFQVGLIQVSRFTEDVVEDGKRTAKKGDRICLAAADESALPSSDDCKALWLYIPNCQPF